MTETRNSPVDLWLDASDIAVDAELGAVGAEATEDERVEMDGIEKAQGVSPFVSLVHSRSSSRQSMASFDSSSSQRSARINRKKAELRLKELREQQEHEKEMQEIERKRALLAAKTQLEEALIEEQELIEEVDDEVSLRFPNKDIRKQYSESGTHLKNPTCHAPSPVGSAGSIDERLVSSINDALRAHMNLPKPELIPFNGKPEDFPRFISSFETTIHPLVNDERAKLNYLIQYCEGTARKCIEDCVVLGSKGYSKARSILKAKFGKPWLIAEGYLKLVTEGPVIKQNDHDAVADLSMAMRKCAIQCCDVRLKAEADSIEVLKKIVKRLPYSLRTEWAKKAHRISVDRSVTFEDLLNFVEEREEIGNSIFGRELSERVRSEPPAGQPKQKQASLRRDARPHEVKQSNFKHMMSDGEAAFAVEDKDEHTVGPIPCAICSGSCHAADECMLFRNAEFMQRQEMIKQHGLCFNCLKKSHVARECQLPPQCTVDGCNRRHHTLMHRWQITNTTERNQVSNQAQMSAATTSAQGSAVYLGIIPVTLKGPNGDIETNALLDNGSTRSFIDADLCKALGLKGTPVKYQVTTLTENDQHLQGDQVQVMICTASNPSGVKVSNVWSAPNLKLPCTSAPRPEDLSIFEHLKDLPLQHVANTPVQLLIGASSDILIPSEIRSSAIQRAPYAEKTVLGWVVRGPTGKCASNTEVMFIQTESDETIKNDLDMLWNADFSDGIIAEKSHPSVEDKTALHMIESSSTMKDGRYEIALPWKDDQPIPNNRTHAVIRLEGTRKKLLRDTEMHRKYTDQMNSYIEEGYAEEAPPDQGARTWYLPHHPVVNVNKPDKVRIVFDGAAKYHGSSINDRLYQGPDLVNSLAGVLMRFRREKVAIMADVKAMFHQVVVPEVDRDALRFLWWPNGDLSAEPKEYRMTRHVFGLRSSPACATFALRKTATDYRGQYKEDTFKSVIENFYVDDLLKSVATEDLAIEIASELPRLLRHGGFELLKWTSNCRDVLAAIPETQRSERVQTLNFENFPHERTLGMEWDPNKDSFCYSVALKDHLITKRGILSAVSSLFDPLGLVAPMLLGAKLLLQNLNRIQLNWDDPLPPDQENQWMDWLKNLTKMREIIIPRIYCSDTSAAHTFELHVFSDASESGYGACAYLRSISDSSVSCSLVMGRSRVAPIRQMSVPRLELTAAVVASKLRALVQSELQINIREVFMWTDSTIVLGYIRNKTARYKSFVANRLMAIHELTQPHEWHYISSKLNPADMASRGFIASEEAKFDFWLHGPPFLNGVDEKWPRDPEISCSPDDPEVKEIVCTTTASLNQDDVALKICTYFSDLNRAVKTTAWWLRLKALLRKQIQSTDEPLSLQEIRAAEMVLQQAAQQRHFAEEIADLRKKRHVKKNSRLLTLAPVLDECLIMTGCRLRFSPSHSRPVVILPPNDPFTWLVIDKAHSENGHVGTDHVLAITRSRYWIMKGRSAVRRRLNSCRQCRRTKAPLGEQQMAPLIKEQLMAGVPAFINIGVDLFGPFKVKIRRSSVKRYGCIFTCLATRAVHLEVVHDLSMDSFLAALSRFSARRGTPMKIFSDRGTNFVAADKELQQELQSWNVENVKRKLRRQGIEWNFNPAHASHRGGLWERLIRSARNILKSLLNEQVLTDEALLTLMTETERIMNSRPLTYVSADSRDLDPLTPAHLLILRGSHGLPLSQSEQWFPRRWWRQVQYLSDIFWRRWTKEYIPSLMKRQKWHRPKPNLKKGDVVLIADLRYPRGRWPMGQVEAVKFGRDGLVRSVIVRTTGGFITRPVTQLCLLEASADD